MVLLLRARAGTFHLDERLPNSLPWTVGDVSRDPPGVDGLVPPDARAASPEANLVPTAFSAILETLLP
jgi:hypothetical protein